MSATQVDQTVCGDCGRAVDLYGGQSAADACTLKDRIPWGVREGTRVEMEWLRKLLGANGVTSSVVRLGLDGSEPGKPVP
ncbi:hypothetical protein EJ065_5218 [Corallococcus coralloides]|uniref:Uncharacterized protein n=1 Tax=Corallococcus coralloides TaxID=184914 RepID=A0A410RY16_CORCK|nr:hypothetical protein EJ065_5218 [Corallococcus coralloides]